MSRMGGDRFGVGRLGELVVKLQPDVVVLVNDPWNIPPYLRHLQDLEIPTVGSIAVDGMNCRGNMLNGLSHTIFWTQFGLDQARQGGYTGPATVVPLGVDLSVYHPTEREESRRRCGLPVPLRGSDTFIVGVVGRNQPRKRLDLAMMYFSAWVKSRDVKNAYLYFHVGPTGDAGFNLGQLAVYLGIDDRVIIHEPEIGHGIPEDKMKFVYGSFDVMLSTTQGEGWGLTHMEGMACGVPQILPNWSALGEWTYPAARLVRCSTYACTPFNINAVGGIMDGQECLKALDELYQQPSLRRRLSMESVALVERPEFRWENIGRQFHDVVTGVLKKDTVEV
jgi:D-inositol-3-phosphate glycosyltransferase